MKTLEAPPPVVLSPGTRTRAALQCALWGHAVDNDVFRTGARCCVRCGIRMLGDDEATVRIGHTLSCFFRHHTYEPVGSRDGHAEYACVRCGHPLLLEVKNDPYAATSRFCKRVHYLCSLFGHRVHVVTIRSGGVEYACGCGHSFIQRSIGNHRITHSLKCFLFGHWVRFVERRGHHSEYACRTCGHAFLFASRSHLAQRAAP